MTRPAEPDAWEGNMDVLKAQAQRVGRQLGGLSVSQWMLAGALAVIMVMTLLYWGRFAATRERVSLLDQSFSVEEMARIPAALKAASIDALPQGDRILVPPDQQYAALAVLGHENLLPKDTSRGFEKLAQSLMNPWDPQKVADVKLGNISDTLLAEIIAQMPGVRSASVMSSPVVPRQIGRDTRPTASVLVTTRGQAEVNPRHLARNVAQFVAGARGAGMTPADVQVAVDGPVYPVDAAGDTAGGVGAAELLERKEQYERNYQRKVLALVPQLPHANVQLTVDLETRTVDERSRTYDPTNTISRERETRTVAEEATAPTAAGDEPGVVSNTSVTLGGAAATAGGAGGGTSRTEEEVKNEVLASVVDRNTRAPPGQPTVSGVAVTVPYSDFLAIWRSHNPDKNDDPGVGILQPLIDDQLGKAKAAIVRALAVKDPEIVSLSYYEDVLPAAVDPAVVAAAAGAGLTGAGVLRLAGSHAREIAIGALAVVSLLMMSSMVRKGSAAPPAPAEEPAGEPPELSAREPLAGEATAGGQLLDGIELDDDAVRTQQMLDQVQTMVKDDPDAAASLVKRWLNRA